MIAEGELTERGSPETSLPELFPDETQDALGPRSARLPVALAPNKIDLASRRIGKTLDDKWRLERLLGVGGMAAVYAATHRNGARAAIKLLPFTLATGPEVCQRLLREGYLANRIQHPAVVRVLDDHIDYDKEHAYIVMELLEGETARQRVERLGPVAPAGAVAMVLELVDCLEAAHASNVIHRDIKPENLYLTSDSLKVLDFGIARALDGNSSLTQTGTSLGTPAYMAPEQARGKQDEISPRSDLYSVGATLLFLLTGETIHHGENALELMVRAAWTPALPAQKICEALPDPLAEIIDRCCAFDPADRYPDAASLRIALKALSGLSDRALPHTTLTRLTSRPPRLVALAEAETISVAQLPLRRHVSPVQLGGGLAVAVLALAVWLWLNGLSGNDSDTDAAAEMNADGTSAMAGQAPPLKRSGKRAVPPDNEPPDPAREHAAATPATTPADDNARPLAKSGSTVKSPGAKKPASARAKAAPTPSRLGNAGSKTSFSPREQFAPPAGQPVTQPKSQAGPRPPAAGAKPPQIDYGQFRGQNP
jgi:serine/threonine-protein kinase